MRRPQRDERWIGPDGDLWQITQVKTRQEGHKRDEKTGKPVSCGRRDLAHFRVRHLETGVEAQVPASELDSWKRKDPDPLIGLRRQITERIRAGAATFILPAALVNKGEIYHLPCGAIRIDKVSEKLVKGKAFREWVVSFTRLIEEREYFLRSVTPKLKPGEKPGEATASEAEKARIEGNYSHVAEPGGDRLPVVHPDWNDPGVAEREEQRRKALVEVNMEEANRKAARKIRAKLDEAPRLGRMGKDLTPQLEDIYQRLNDALEEAA